MYMYQVDPILVQGHMIGARLNDRTHYNNVVFLTIFTAWILINVATSSK